MEQTVKTKFDKSAYNPILSKTYKIIKKSIKYSLYLALFYFAYEGFMAWK